MRRRQGMLILEMLAGILLFTAVMVLFGGATTGEGFGGWSESQEATIARLGVDGRPTLVVFETDWCGACRWYKPQLRAAKKNHPRVYFKLVDAEQDPATFRELGFRAFPSSLLIAPDGTPVESWKGAIDGRRLDGLLSSHGY